MQTFLPYESFAESAAALDQARLGKQRVETLQVLRSLLLPTYGWQNHPVTKMWRGFLPGLTAYGLATVDEWVRRGHTDSTRHLIAEFAPGVVGKSQEELAERRMLPAWIGDEELHRSHRSNLVRKAPEYYRPMFPDVPDDLDYLWPPEGERPPAPSGEPLWVVRPRTGEDLTEWQEEGFLAVGERSPLGRDTPNWRAQVAAFVDALEPGTEVGALVGNDGTVHRATVTGDVQTRVEEAGTVTLVRAAEFAGTLARTDFTVPAILQDPRSVFTAPLRTDG
jgi:hypothetical protein